MLCRTGYVFLKRLEAREAVGMHAIATLQYGQSALRNAGAGFYSRQAVGDEAEHVVCVSPRTPKLSQCRKKKKRLLEDRCTELCTCCAVELEGVACPVLGR